MSKRPSGKSLRSLLSGLGRYTRDQRGIANIFREIQVLGKTKRLQGKKFVDETENDLEHEGQLAKVCYYVIVVFRKIKKFKKHLEKLNPLTVVLIALKHDDPEFYAGDTPRYGSSKKLLESKRERELKAVKKLKRRWPREIIELIEEYEHRTSPEATFVYSMDKLVPVFNIVHDGGRNWIKYRITYEAAMQELRRAHLHPAVAKIAIMLEKELSKKKYRRLFYPYNRRGKKNEKK